MTDVGDGVISPYVRRRRLAAEIVRLREDHGYSAERLATAIGVGRQRISRVENGHVRPDLHEIMKILEVFGVGATRWEQIITIAREAQERGWWESFGDEMGARQCLYANLEAGARTICEYHQTFVPSLMQTREFTLARLEVDRASGPLPFDPDRAVEAREGRQRMLRRPGGPSYELILDELVIRRLSAPPLVVEAQLRHLKQRAEQLPIRVLPIDARIAGYRMPRSAFSIYTYPDPADPTVVVVDTVTTDHVAIGAPQTQPYTDLYDRLRDACLSRDDSRAFLHRAADHLTADHETERRPA